MSVLVLLRHGESAWNAADIFTGWIDVGLSEHGERQAHQVGALLAASGNLPDVVHMSVQRRAIRSADLALAACGRSWIPVRRSWRLNSNHYGALHSSSIWRRSATRRYRPSRCRTPSRCSSSSSPDTSPGS